MQNNSILYGIIGLLLGIVVTTYVASNAVNNNNMQMMRMMGMGPKTMMGADTKSGMMMGMNEMSHELEGKNSDEFDRAFINLMIDHHQGAINMANAAKLNAKHEEIKSLADDIITAQTSEIEKMRQWSKNWGY